SHEPCSASERIGDNGKAEAAAVSETTTTACRAAATTTRPFGARLALDARDGVNPGCARSASSQEGRGRVNRPSPLCQYPRKIPPRLKSRNASCAAGMKLGMSFDQIRRIAASRGYAFNPLEFPGSSDSSLDTRLNAATPHVFRLLDHRRHCERPGHVRIVVSVGRKKKSRISS